MKQLFFGTIIILLIFSGSINAQSFAAQQNKKLGRGVNLGNALEAPTEGEWGVTLNESYFKLIAEKGFNSIRVPIRWSSHALTNTPYTIDATFFMRIDWVIQNALKNKLLVIINCHHYNEMFENPSAHKQRFLSIWSQIARRYASYSDSLIFEPLNEPNTNLTAELWNDYFSNAMDTIRHSNPKRTAVVGIGEWGGIGGLSKLVLPNDTNLILTVHYYNPYQFTHQGAEWVSGTDAWLGTGWYNTEAERKTVDSDFSAVRTFAATHTIPVHVGEFGSYSKADMDSRIRWTNYCARYFEEQGFSWAYWEYCSGFGIYDASTATWNQALLDALQILPMSAPFVDPTGNMVFNGDFSYGITQWTKYTDASASASFAVSGQKGTVSVTNGGTTDWSVQLYNAGFTIENGKKYHLEFNAYGSVARSINLSIGKASSPYTPYFSSNALLTTSNKKFVFDFTMGQATDNSARLVFNLGKIAGNVYFENVMLRETSATPIAQVKTKEKLLIYPMPAQQSFTVEHEGITSISIYNSSGTKILALKRNGEPSACIDCSAVSKGFYIIQVEDKAGNTFNSIIEITE